MVQQVEVKVAKFTILFMFSKKVVNKELPEVLSPPLSPTVINKLRHDYVFLRTTILCRILMKGPK